MVNYLAHAYLSFDDPAVQTGNMISDFVKGSARYNYPSSIQKGITLHRAIDEFTDSHIVNKTVARIFKPAYGLYSGAFLDVAYDHFLASAIAAGGDDAFREYTLTVYNNLEKFEPVFPGAFRSIFPYMRMHNWLYNYQFSFGIQKSFEGLVHRAKYLDDSGPAVAIFEKHYHDLKTAFDNFFPQLKAFALEKFSDIH